MASTPSPGAEEMPSSSYDQVASKYEARFLDELDGKPRDRELLEAFAASVGDPLVELGCGPGQIGAFVRDLGLEVLGFDLSFEMARLAGKRLRAAGVADLRALPFGDGRLGGALAFYSLIHIPRPELRGALGEMRRVLRPGGRILFSAHEGQGEVVRDEFLGDAVPFRATLFELDELVEACTAAGFEVRNAERRAPYPSESATTRLFVEAERADRARS